MKIIIVGCGKIGVTILSSLVAEGHDVIAVDNNPDAIAEISNVYDVMCVTGNGADCDTLAEAGVSNTGLFVAVTGSDELNMLSCFVARRMGATHTIARIRNPEFNDSSLGFMRQQLDLSMSINPEQLASEELYNILKLPGAVNIETFSNRNFQMAEFIVRSDSPLIGVPLPDLRKQYRANFLICTVQRDDRVFIPDGSCVLQDHDRIGVIANPIELHKLFRLIGKQKKQLRNVMVLGASTIAYYLAEKLIASNNSVKIIEQDRERCLEFSDKLPEVVMIHGDGAQQELLVEEGIRSVDAFLTLTGMDEQNILVSCYAASQKVPKVITKVNRDELAYIGRKLGLDSIVSPKKIISDILVRYARALNNSEGSKMETMYKIMDGQAEAAEFIVEEDFKYINIPLREMRLKPQTLIAGIIRGRKTVIPSGDDQIMAGDHVIVITAGRQLNDLRDILS